MRYVLLGGFLASIAAGPAFAGAWPRGEGGHFLSVEGTVTSPFEQAFSTDCEGPPVPGSGGPIFRPDGTFEITPDRCPTGEAGGLLGFLGLPELGLSSYGTLFYEYGLSETLTLGLDVGYEFSDDSWTALGFLRRSFDTGGPNVWALELAAGPARSWNGEGAQVLRPGLHWGRGTDWGWLGAESYAVFRSDLDGTAWKLDLTAGWNRSDTVSWIAQVLTADYPGSDTTVRLAPSYVWRLSDTMRVRLGALADLAGGEDWGAVAATWFEF